MLPGRKNTLVLGLEADVADTRGGLVDIRELLKSGLALRDRREELTDLGFQRKLT
ncbi:MAG: hypothetical protein IH899_07245, partial [Planctomycetes bacterium]|nr:hypothetical protein [Planctomycetota bacterium]